MEHRQCSVSIASCPSAVGPWVGLGCRVRLFFGCGATPGPAKGSLVCPGGSRDALFSLFVTPGRLLLGAACLAPGPANRGSWAYVHGSRVSKGALPRSRPGAAAPPGVKDHRQLRFSVRSQGCNLLHVCLVGKEAVYEVVRREYWRWGGSIGEGLLDNGEEQGVNVKGLWFLYRGKEM